MGVSNLNLVTKCFCLIVFIIFGSNFASGDGLSSFDWDMAIAHGRNLTLISASSNTSIEIQIPPPINPMKRWGNKDLNPGVIWKSQVLSLLAFDSPNKVFFTMTSKDVTTVGLYDLSSNQTTLLYQSHTAVTIDGLAFRAGVLYWTDTTSQVIQTMNNSRNEPWESVQPIVFLKFNNQKIHGLAVDPETGTIFWANWATQSIEYSINNSVNHETLVTGVAFSQSLKVVSSFIYFTNRPPGADLKIERVNLKNRTDRIVLYRGRYQTPFTVSPVCGNSVMWTDQSSRTVFFENGTTVIFFRQYSDTVPNGFIIKDLQKFDQGICPLVGKEISGKSGEAETQKVPKNMEMPTKTSISLEVVPEANSNANSPDPQVVNVSSSKRNMKLEADWCGNWEKNNCMNGATCVSLDNSIFCLCPPDFSGTRCEVNSSLSPMDKEMLVTSSVLAALVIILIIVVTILGWRVCKLRQRPKIRRRVILAKSSESQNPPSVCEMIDIENCCNMNLCETPCYEISSTGATGNRKPTSGSGSPGHTSPSKEDKQRLIEDV